MPAALLRAQLTDQALTLREQARAEARRTLPDSVAIARALALAICEVEAGLRSASQLERICHPSLWEAVANRVQRAGGPSVSGSSVLRMQVQELTPGLVDAVAVVRRGQRATFIALRLEAVPGRWDPSMSSALGRSSATVSRMEQLVERAMAYAVEEYDEDLAVARLARLARNDQAALTRPVMSVSAIPTSTWASAAGRSGC